ncbi:MAG TPA: hypothetical protein VLG28_14385 [Acidimicrobiia bacterium]|nr:hypothetical protein [Acidimicrobiia bacterium]
MTQATADSPIWVRHGDALEVVDTVEAWDHINQLVHVYFDAPFGGLKLGRVILKIRPDRIVEHRPE